tara:strand:- start:1072 stop:1317 length:246 start_codon:yes stop_codon:yes gene_type:complete
MSRRVLFFGANNSTFENEYTLGAGVGRKTIPIRNALSKRGVISPDRRVKFTLGYIPGRARNLVNFELKNTLNNKTSLLDKN